MPPVLAKLFQRRIQHNRLSKQIPCFEKRLAGDVFLQEFEQTMNRKAKGHSAAFLKRQANKIKKQLGITHAQALDKAAQNVDFSNWSNFLNLSTGTVLRKKRKIKPRLNVPSPSVLEFYPALSSIRHLRPNHKMPVPAHVELGSILKLLKKATEEHKRASRPLKDVAHLLDEWVQKEYTDRNELSDAVFFNLYFGDDEIGAETSPSEERKAELIKFCQRAKAIIARNYHDCGPVRELLRKIDQSIKWLGTWPAIKPNRLHGRLGTDIPKGSFIYLKSQKKPAILINHQTRRHVVNVYTNQGPATLSRSEIVVPKDQSGSNSFKPMRLWLPYGKWTCEDGSEVLFNRDYLPLWAKSKDSKVIELDPDIWVDGKDDGEFFFNDRTAPWHKNKETLSFCKSILINWGVADRVPKLLALLPEAVRTGDLSVLKPKHTDKYFPPRLA